MVSTDAALPKNRFAIQFVSSANWSRILAGDDFFSLPLFVLTTVSCANESTESSMTPLAARQTPIDEARKGNCEDTFSFSTESTQGRSLRQSVRFMPDREIRGK
jgi:hypothetical protein